MWESSWGHRLLTLIKFMPGSSASLLKQKTVSMLTTKSWMIVRWNWVDFFPILFFFQFFADVKEADEKIKRMQENMKKKYTCDRSTTSTRLEDLLQDAVVGISCILFTCTGFIKCILTPCHFCQDEREQLNEFKTHMASLNKRAKSIIQLKPRNPTTPIKGKLPIQAVCDFKQMEVSSKSTCTLIKSHIPLLLAQAFSFLVLNRSQCIKEKSVPFSTTLNLINGRFLTSQAMSLLYLLYASLCHQWTKRL